VKAAIYVPHGAIPDKRGFAPAIVAWNHARRLKKVAPVIISAREDFPGAHEIVDGIPVYRIGEGRLYRRVFRKLTRLDPYPLHRRAAKILRQEPVALVHAHVTAARFDERCGVADRYLAASRYVRDRLVVEKNFPPARIEVLPNGVDTALFAPARAQDAGCRSLLIRSKCRQMTPASCFPRFKDRAVMCRIERQETLLAPKPWTTILNNLQFGSGLPHLLRSDDILVVEQCPKAQGLAAFRVLT
jgi:glycosyltransferase involved in cell wall biosynthesis